MVAPPLAPVAVLAENAGHLTFGALSGDGSTVAYGSRESGLVQLRSIRGVPELPGVDAGCPVLSCAFGNTPTVLLAALADGRVSIWDLPAGRRTEMRGHDGEVLACAMTADGTLAASAGDDDDVRLWRLPELALLATLRGHQWTVTGCGFDADGTLLVSAGGDGTACLWDTAAAQTAQPAGHSQLVECCGFTAGDDGTLILVPSPEAEAVPVCTHGAQVWGLSLVEGGAAAITAGLDGACRAWDLGGGRERPAFPGDGHPLRACAADPSGSRVAAAGDAGIVHVHDLATRSHTELAGHQAPIWSVGMGPAGQIAAGAKDGSVHLWRSSSPAAGQLLGRQGDSVEHLVWAGSEHLISGAVDGGIAVWPLIDDGAPLQWAAHRGPVRDIAVAPAGEVLVSAGADGLLAAWRLRDGTLLAAIPFPGQLRTVARPGGV